MFNAMKVFSATTSAYRSDLGTRVTDWLRTNPGVVVVDKRVLQSSDEQFHCLTIVLFYRDAAWVG